MLVPVIVCWLCSQALPLNPNAPTTDEKLLPAAQPTPAAPPATTPAAVPAAPSGAVPAVTPEVPSAAPPTAPPAAPSVAVPAATPDIPPAAPSELPAVAPTAPPVLPRAVPVALPEAPAPPVSFAPEPPFVFPPAPTHPTTGTVRNVTIVNLGKVENKPLEQLYLKAYRKMDEADGLAKSHRSLEAFNAYTDALRLLRQLHAADSTNRSDIESTMIRVRKKRDGLPGL